MDAIPEGEWIEHIDPQYWSLPLKHAELSLSPRPPYCDRGPWYGQAWGIPSLDGEDGFPRYYMDLQRAKDEMKEWLIWRLARDAGPYPA